MSQTYREYQPDENKLVVEDTFAKWLSGGSRMSNVASIRKDLLCDDGTDRYPTLVELNRVSQIQDSYFNLRKTGYPSIQTIMTHPNKEQKNKYFNYIEKRSGDVFCLFDKRYEVFVEVDHMI